MCGICGTISIAGQPSDPRLLARMLATIRHRGPDSSGVYVDGHIGLGHARLSIIDLAGGIQPMQSADGSLAITFNGEIFNYIELREELVKRGHRFATRSDTEVILHLYEEEGVNCVQRMNGQWSFALWDSRRQRLFLSRDRLGVRPLFYAEVAGTFYFASEIKALFACPGTQRGLDLEALDQIFTFWVTLPPRTAFCGVRQLPPGHSMVIEQGKVSVSKYWQLELSPESGGDEGREDTLREQLLDLLRDAVRIRLRSDVPVGSYLSGGLDSSLITALANQVAGERLRTFSVSFDEAEFDESGYQFAASAFFGTQHEDFRCCMGDIADVFPHVVWHAEQPILRTAPGPMFLLSRLVRNRGFKVVLTGEGADELFGGYDIFKEAKIRLFLDRYPDSRWRPLLLKRLYPYMDGLQRQSPLYLKQFFRASNSHRMSPFFSHLPRWELTEKLKSFFSEAVRSETRNFTPLETLSKTLPTSFSEWDAFSKAEYLEASQLLPGYILSSQGDRMAMANSIEARYPFLDVRVIEFAAKLSTRLKMRVLKEKHLLKSVARGLIPETIRNRHKQPYRAPDGESFFAGRVGYVEELLSEERVRKDGIFHPASVNALVSKFRKRSRTSTRDNMALVGILSTQILLESFTNHAYDHSSSSRGLPH
jgi:asparagine synthase (glutamine-hydrolysing)